MFFFSRSRAEISSVRKEILYEFPFGINYAWMLLIFALTGTHPAIWEFQLLTFPANGTLQIILGKKEYPGIKGNE